MLVSLLVLGVNTAVAQSPEDVVRAFFKAEDEGRWTDAARMLDLDRFRPFLKSAIDNLRATRTFPARTAEDLMKWEPDMPRAVAEYQAKKLNEGFRSFDLIEREFAHVNSVDSLARLSTETAAARWLEASGPAWQEVLARRQMANTPAIDCPPLPDSVTNEFAKKMVFPQPRVTILGATSGSDSVSYVVVSDAFAIMPANGPGVFDGESFRSPSAMILRRLGGFWKIVPTADLPRNDMALSSTMFSIRCKTDSTKRSAPRK